MPVEALDRPELTDLLRRLGIKTLGRFRRPARRPTCSPGSGSTGRSPTGSPPALDHRPLAVRQPPPDLDVSDTYDEPLERVDVAAFAGRALAERLHDRLAAHGLACTRLGIEAVTADGQELHRVWRHDGTAHRRRDRRTGALAARRLAHRRPPRRAGTGPPPAWSGCG